MKNDHQMRKHKKKHNEWQKRVVGEVGGCLGGWLVESEKISEEEFHFPLKSLPSRFD